MASITILQPPTVVETTLPSLRLSYSAPKPPKAPTVIGPTTKKATRPTKPIPQFLIDEARETVPEKWNADKHLVYQPPASITTMAEIGLEGHGISPVAVSEPFPLFSKDAVMQVRREIFSDAVMRDCQYASTFSSNMVRGMGHERAPFTCSAWYDPQTIAKVSEVAGIDLVPALDTEIANINISINDQHEPQEKTRESTSAFSWHYDSFPFVCVTMVSDCTGMVGGETAIRLPDGSIRKVRGPTMGTAVVMQGRYIYHQALKAFGGRERIAMVTAFRPRSIHVPDETILTGSRPISNLDELYPEYVNYRLRMLEERFRAKQQDEQERKLAHRRFCIEEMRDFLTEQKEYIETMLEHVYEIE